MDSSPELAAARAGNSFGPCWALLLEGVSVLSVDVMRLAGVCLLLYAGACWFFVCCCWWRGAGLVGGGAVTALCAVQVVVVVVDVVGSGQV